MWLDDWGPRFFARFGALTSLKRASFRRAAFEAEGTGMANCGEPEMGGPGLRRPGLAPFSCRATVFSSRPFFFSAVCRQWFVLGWIRSIPERRVLPGSGLEGSASLIDPCRDALH